MGGGVLALFLSPVGKDWRIAHTSTADLLLNSLSSPQDISLQKSLLKRYVEEGKIAEAVEVSKRLTALSPNDATLWIEQSRLLYTLGNFSEAGESAQRALQQKRSAEVLVILGDVQAMLGDRAQAKQHYQEATQLDPNSEQAWAGLALLATDEHQFAEAVSLLQKISNPKSDAAFLAKGYLEEQEGLLEQARASYEKSLSIDPNQIRTILLLIALQIRDAHISEAPQKVEELLQRAERLAPGSRSVPYYRGLLHLSQKHLPEAEQEFQAALNRDPNFTDALFQLSQVQVRQGKQMESEKTRQRFEAVNDYQRDINNLQIRIGRSPEDASLWRQMKVLAEAHQDAPRVQLAEQRLQSLSH